MEFPRRYQFDDRRRPTRPAIQRATGVVIAVVVTASLASCSDAPDPQPTASALAEAVQSGDFSEVTFANATAEDAAAAVEEMAAGMGEVARSVEVLDIEARDDDAGRDVTLEVTWDVDPSQDWTYSTTASLTLAGDGWQAQWAPNILHPQLTEGASLVLHRSQAERGEIVGAGGTVIVTERPVYRVGIDKSHVDAATVAQSAADLAELVEVDAASFVSRVAAAGPKAFVEAITLREDDAGPMLASIEEIEGASAIEDTLALAPTREFARPILGTVGAATAEIVEESGGRTGAGDVVGLSGLQEQYDGQLRGSPGLIVEVVPADTSAASAEESASAEEPAASAEGSVSAEEPAEEPQSDPEVVFERAAVPGSPVTTALDVELQLLAEEILADVAPPSAIVAVQPSTGAVVAAASGPGGEGYSTATLGQYAPGSTFKIITALALLRAGVEPETMLDCAETVTVDGKSFKNYSDYPDSEIGEISLRSVVANSCNTALINQRDTVTQADLAQAAAALGLGAATEVGAPAFLGDVPAEAASTEHAASMIGQGKILASPMVMATVAASVAAGRTVMPWIVDGAAERQSTLTADEASVLQELMRAVVEEGSAEFLRDVPGEPVGAKTGTAEYGSEDPPQTHAWMVATHDDLAVAVFVEDGESGSQTAGPLLEDFLRSAG